jgi:hypothetical protein
LKNVEIEMKNGIQCAALLGAFASATFSLQAASLAATSAYAAPTAGMSTCAVVNPPNAASKSSAAADVDPAQDKIFIGGL